MVVNLFAAVGMKSGIALNFLSRWPTLDELRRAKAQTVRSFFYAHNSGSQSLIEKRLQQIAQAHCVTHDLALIEPLVLTTKCLVAQLRQFNDGVITVASLETYVDERVKHLTNGSQTPVMAKPRAVPNYPIAVKK